MGQRSEITSFGWIGIAERRMNVFGFDLAIDGAELTILIEVTEDKIVLADKVKSAAIAIETENSGSSLVGQVGTRNIRGDVIKIILEACPVFEVERVVGIGSKIRADALIGTVVKMSAIRNKIDSDVIGTLTFDAMISAVTTVKLFIVKRICGGHGATPFRRRSGYRGSGCGGR